MEPTRDHEDFKKDVKNVQNWPQTASKSPKLLKGGFSKENTALTPFFQGFVRDSKTSGLLTYQGT